MARVLAACGSLAPRPVLGRCPSPAVAALRSRASLGPPLAPLSRSIYEKIGKGKHSVVYKGRKKKTIQYYAVKSVEKSQKARVLQEVRAGVPGQAHGRQHGAPGAAVARWPGNRQRPRHHPVPAAAAPCVSGGRAWQLAVASAAACCILATLHVACRCAPCTRWTTRTSSGSTPGAPTGRAAAPAAAGAARQQRRAGRAAAAAAAPVARRLPARRMHAARPGRGLPQLRTDRLPRPHPPLPPRYETTNHLWLILEYCVGGDLMSLLRQDVALPETSVHDFARDMVVALQYLHASSIIYCDIKARAGPAQGVGGPGVGWRRGRRRCSVHAPGPQPCALAPPHALAY